MSSKKEFQHYITDMDRIDMEFDMKRGNVIAFVANYRAHIRGKWVEVCRYDTRHGILHVHKFWKAKHHQTTPLERKALSSVDNNRQLTVAEEDLKENWQNYRQRMEEVNHEQD